MPWDLESISCLGLPDSVDEGGGQRGVDGGGGGSGVPRQDPDLVLQIGNPPILGLHLHTENLCICIVQIKALSINGMFRLT